AHPQTAGGAIESNTVRIAEANRPEFLEHAWHADEGIVVRDEVVRRAANLRLPRRLVAHGPADAVHVDPQDAGEQVLVDLLAIGELVRLVASFVANAHVQEAVGPERHAAAVVPNIAVQ